MADDKDKAKRTVPLATLMEERTKHKEDKTILEAKLAQLEKQLAEVQSSVDYEKRWGFPVDDDDEQPVKDKLMAIEKALRQRDLDMTAKEKALSVREGGVALKTKEFEDKERSNRKKELVAQYGVDEVALEEVLETEPDMEKAIYRLVAETKGTSTVYERGTPGSATKSVRSMTPPEFETHVKTEREKALAKA